MTLTGSPSEVVMFRTLPMQRVALRLLTDDAQKASVILADSALFAPEEQEDESLPELPAAAYRDQAKQARGRLLKILDHCGESLDQIPSSAGRVVPIEELNEIDRFLAEAWGQCSRTAEQLATLADDIKHVDELLQTLTGFESLPIDFGWLQSEKRFVDTRLGTLPAENVGRLQESLGLASYVLIPFLYSDGIVHAFVAGLKEEEQPQDIEGVMRAAGWRAIRLPPEFTETPERMRAELEARRTALEVELREVEKQREAQKREYLPQVIGAAQTVLNAWPYVELADALRARGQLATLTGWVTKRDLPTLRGRFEQELGSPVVVESRDPMPEERAPTATEHHPLLRPFFALVKTYGVPRYGEWDPTLLFAITFVLMFGMMFGDIGHGAIIAGAALIWRRALGQFTLFLVAAGLSSMGFGLAYGSVFGFEHLIPHDYIWMSPLEDPLLMLTLAFSWGVGFIVIATLITIYNRLQSGERSKALMDGKGLAGLLLFAGLLAALYQLLNGAPLGSWNLAAILFPLGVVAVYQWQHNRVALGERILVVLIELFETLMSFVSGTLSFLRVAAFSLNHVALAIAVFTLAEMMEGASHWGMIILGNLFILVLEGAIVAIQTLRLEYYEGFSRFFAGDGREFRPLTLEVGRG